MACHGCQYVVYALAQGMPFANFRQIIGQIFYQPLYICLPQRGGCLTHDNGVTAKLFQHQAKFRKLAFAGSKPRDRRLVKLHNLGDSSVDFVVRPWVRTEDYWDVHWDVTREVKMRFDAEGVSIPFPQRDVHFYRENGTAAEP